MTSAGASYEVVVIRANSDDVRAGESLASRRVQTRGAAVRRDAPAGRRSAAGRAAPPAPARGAAAVRAARGPGGCAGRGGRRLVARRRLRGGRRPGRPRRGVPAGRAQEQLDVGTERVGRVGRARGRGGRGRPRPVRRRRGPVGRRGPHGALRGGPGARRRPGGGVVPAGVRAPAHARRPRRADRAAADPSARRRPTRRARRHPRAGAARPGAAAAPGAGTDVLGRRARLLRGGRAGVDRGLRRPGLRHVRRRARRPGRRLRGRLPAGEVQQQQRLSCGPRTRASSASRPCSPTPAGSAPAVRSARRCWPGRPSRATRRVVTDWRAPNLLSSRAWPALGFRPTFLRLHRLLGH